jgi:type II secretory pathway predicted ATPase ExeA
MLKDLGEQKFRTAYINNPMIAEPAELIRSIVRALSPQTLPEKKTELLLDPLLEKLHHILLENVRDGKENVIIIDEAHTVEDTKIFEQLRMILNFQSENKFLLSLILLGQPELKDMVDVVKPFAQRIPIRCYIGPLAQEDVAKYISQRIKTAGGEKNITTVKPEFDQDALKIIFDYSGGIPRRINTLCDLILLSGFAKKHNKLDSDFIMAVIKEFNLN